MKLLRFLFFLAALAILAGILLSRPAISLASAPQASLDRWQVMPIGTQDRPADSPPASGSWEQAGPSHTLVQLPHDANGVWIRLQVPATSAWHRPGLLVGRLYGLELEVYQRGELLYESRRDFEFDLTRLLLPLDTSDRGTELDVRIVTTRERAGFLDSIRIGEFDELERSYIQKELPSLLLGAAIIFLALLMLVCSSFLSKSQRRFWISLCVIALTAGILIASYSPLLYLYYPSAGPIFLVLFELSLYTMFPALGYFVNETLERNSPRFLRFSQWQACYSAFGIAAYIAYKLSDGSLYSFYSIVSIGVAGLLILVQLIWISVLSIIHGRSGNRQARVLATGLLALAGSGAVDLILYYASGKSYILFLWKLGIVAFIFSLVVILSRRVSSDYKKLLSYSRQLEQFNMRLERTEKLKIISDLAASVAHEIRNPLQVTRGFLQMLTIKEDAKSKRYISTAISELDRAAEIITDFLTFAKPELEVVSRLEISELLQQLDLIMKPLAAMNRGRLEIVFEEGLTIMGSASKLKQALINLIKNSVEAWGEEDGVIELTARAEGSEAVLRIKDNGEGMDEEQLANLGVPYFSTKSKGTGLGTMVTIRIIEIMSGTIDFRSQVGKGTEVTIRFPLAPELASELTAASKLPG